MDEFRGLVQIRNSAFSVRIFVSLLCLIFLHTETGWAGNVKDAYESYKKGLEAMKQEKCQKAMEYFKAAILEAPEREDGKLRIQRRSKEYLPNAKLRELEQTCGTPQETGHRDITTPSWSSQPLKLTAYLSRDQNRGIRRRTKDKICGQVTGGEGRIWVTVDGENVPLGRDGRFEKEIPLRPRTIIVQAQDQTGRVVEQTVSVSPETVVEKPDPLPVGIKFSYGRCFALVIGNNNYRYISKLEAARNDAREVARILERDYGFSVEMIMDVSREDIINALDNYRKKLTRTDNLLIYYSGHGWLDKDADEGYWLPVNAKSGYSANWLSVATVTTKVRAIKAKHVLVVSDSCYSGKLTKSGIKGIVRRDLQYYSRVGQKKARSVISSGGLEPVIDGGGKSGHSVFASSFLDALKENEDIMDAAQIFSKVRPYVIYNSDQTPEYAPIHKAGHDGGEFLFIRQR